MKFDTIHPESGTITIALERVFKVLQLISFQRIFNIKNRADITSEDKTGFEGASSDKQRAVSIIRVKKIDYYILGFFIFEIIGTFILLYHHATWMGILIITIFSLRIIEIFQVNVNLVIFDSLRISTEKHFHASRVRMIINPMVNIVELIICYGAIYFYFSNFMTGTESMLDAYYFSAIAQISLGFDEKAPQEGLKFVVISQILISYFFSLLLLGRFIGLLPNINFVAEPRDRH